MVLWFNSLTTESELRYNNSMNIIKTFAEIRKKYKIENVSTCPGIFQHLVIMSAFYRMVKNVTNVMEGILYVQDGNKVSELRYNNSMNIIKLKSAARVQVIDMNDYHGEQTTPTAGDSITADEFIEEYLGLTNGSTAAPQAITEAFRAYMDASGDGNSNYLVCTIVNGQIEVVTA